MRVGVKQVSGSSGYSTDWEVTGINLYGMGGPCRRYLTLAVTSLFFFLPGGVSSRHILASWGSFVRRSDQETQRLRRHTEHHKRWPHCTYLHAMHYRAGNDAVRADA